MKVKIYSSANKNKSTTLKIETEKQLRDLVLLAKSEAFRMGFLKDIDYDSVKLVFKVDGEKMSASEIARLGEKYLNDRGDSDKSEGKKKKKKGKKKDKDGKKKDKSGDGKKKKKKKKNGGDKKDGKKKPKKVEVEDGYVHMTRIY